MIVVKFWNGFGFGSGGMKFDSIDSALNYFDGATQSGDFYKIVDCNGFTQLFKIEKQ